MKEYRIIEGFGPYFNKRWELQEKYHYYEEDGIITFAWKTVYHSSEKENCEEALKRRLAGTDKNYSVDAKITLKMF